MVLILGIALQAKLNVRMDRDAHMITQGVSTLNYFLECWQWLATYANQQQHKR